MDTLALAEREQEASEMTNTIVFLLSEEAVLSYFINIKNIKEMN